MLKAKQRAIGLLAMGYDVFQVARLCACSRATVYRWQQQEEFAAARDMHIREMMTAMHAQIQATARDYIEGNLDAVRELRHLVLDPRVAPAVRRSACNDLARHSGRWYDLMGFNAKLESSKKLAVDEPDAPNAEEVPDDDGATDALRDGATDASLFERSENNNSSVPGALHPEATPHAFASATPPPSPLPVDGEGEPESAARPVAERSPAPLSPQEAPRENLAHQLRQDALHADPLEEDAEECADAPEHEPSPRHSGAAACSHDKQSRPSPCASVAGESMTRAPAS